eukprot:3088817-Amphidinium_carterae.1
MGGWFVQQTIWPRPRRNSRCGSQHGRNPKAYWQAAVRKTQAASNTDIMICAHNNMQFEA